ncbi:uncharacterized protein LOC125044091 [Penaeus chinensis]|uniref:uncharacterized protein LOC125044091 n=1 Tax=Penaeus chinensis TaxID=139456 RepID=UPI001FB82B67|nr:uncharacterized protein LOC125044091 [Penaeus chinensis]
MGPHCLVGLVILILASTELQVTGAALKPDQVKEVWVVAGERAEMPCAPSPKLSLDKPVLVLWYRSSDTLPVYSYDARAGEFSSGSRWADESALGGRADFNVLSETPTLVLEPAQPRDEGVYTCRVDYRLSVSTKTVVNLTVTYNGMEEAYNEFVTLLNYGTHRIMKILGKKFAKAPGDPDNHTQETLQCQIRNNPA